MQVTGFSEGTVSGAVSASNAWESLMANSQNTVNMGAIVSSQGSTPGAPTSLSISGVPCSLSG